MLPAELETDAQVTSNATVGSTRAAASSRFRYLRAHRRYSIPLPTAEFRAGGNMAFRTERMCAMAASTIGSAPGP